MGVMEFIDEAAGIVGSRWIRTKEWELYAYSRDYWPYLVYKDIRGEKPRLPAAVILPGNEEEVTRIVDAASEHGVPILVYAGGSGVLGGAVPDEGWIILDLSRLDWIEWYDEESGIIDVGAGVFLKDLETWLNSKGMTLRHFPQSYPEAMVGGLVATRSVGQYSTGYGGIEDMVLGLHVVVPRYGLVRVKPSPRRSVLIPLEELFIGSEGLYGVITRVYLRALDLPEYSLLVGWRSGFFEEALDEARLLTRRRIVPELFRVYNEAETMVHFKQEGSVSIGVIEGSHNVVEARRHAIEELIGRDVLECVECTRDWLEKRFNVINDIYNLYKTGMGFETIEVSIHWGRVKEFYRESLKELGDIPGVVFTGVHASHFYHAGVALYYTFAFDLTRFEEAYNGIWSRLMNTVSRFDGSISHHHGVGRMRLRYLEKEYGSKGVSLLGGIKQAMDPGGVLRDKVLGDY